MTAATATATAALAIGILTYKNNTYKCTSLVLDDLMIGAFRFFPLLPCLF